MSAPLSTRQKRYLAILANRAFDLAQARGEAVLDCGCGKGAATSFRHNQVIKASRKHGLRCCGQNQYKAIEAHFLDLVGEPGLAMKADLLARTEPHRQAMFLLERACRNFNLPLTYADAICRRQNRGLGLDDVGPQTLKFLMFTIRNRGKRKQAA